MKNKVKVWLYQSPAILVLLAAFIGSIVVKISGDYPVRWASIIILGTVIGLFFVGKYYECRYDHHY